MRGLLNGKSSFIENTIRFIILTVNEVIEIRAVGIVVIVIFVLFFIKVLFG